MPTLRQRACSIASSVEALVPLRLEISVSQGATALLSLLVRRQLPLLLLKVLMPPLPPLFLPLLLQTAPPPLHLRPEHLFLLPVMLPLL